MIIQNGNLVLEDGICLADLRIVDGKIAKIASQIPPQEGESVLDAQGKYILPGGVDVHTHFDMPAGNCHTSDDFYSGTLAAIIGGTTTIIDFAECQNPQYLQEGLDSWHHKAKNKSYCDYGFHMTLSCWNNEMPEQVQSMIAQGVTSFKAYTAYKGSMGVGDRELFEMMECLERENAVLCVHCENGDVLEALQEKYRALDAADIRNHPRSRPNLVEKEAVSRVLDIAALTGVQIYIVHVSAKESIAVIEQAKKERRGVYAETCPHYLLLQDDCYALPNFEAAKFVMSPPLRKKEDSTALWNALKDETIDSLSTDHCSFYFKGQKELGLEDFTKIPNGIPGVEHRVSLMLSEGLAQGIPLEQLVRLLSTNPAKIFGLYPQKGVLAEGSDGDILIVSKDAPYRITAETSLQKSDYTPFEGFTSFIRVEDVFLRGCHLVKKGELLHQPPSGEYLYRQPIQKTNG